MYTWRLGTEIDALVYVPGNNVLLAPAEKKSDSNAAMSKSNMDKTKIPFKIQLTENKFKIKFSEDLVPQVKHKDLPGGEWYRVRNIVFDDHICDEVFRKELGKMITAAGSLDGSEKIFEVAFSEEYPGKVRLVTDTSEDYSECFNEMNRRLNCKLYKKTKKWIPGHRYDTDYCTYYYLGDFYCNRENSYNSVYKRSTDTVPLVIEDIGDCNSISEVFKTKSFGKGKNNIYALEAVKLAVDSGEVLKSDVPNIQDLWDDMVDLVIDNPEFDTGNIFEIFAYSSKPITSPIVDPNKVYGWRDRLEIRLEEELTRTCLTFWDIKSNVVSDNCRLAPGFANNAEGLWDLYTESYLYKVMNVRKIEYYKTLLDELGIDILALCDQLTNSFTLHRDIFNSFDLYQKYGKYYFKYHDAKMSRVDSIQRKGRRSGITSENVRLESVYPEVLKNKLIELINYSISNYGAGVDRFMLRNDGTKHSPITYYDITIKLKNIIESYKSLSEMPENLKNEIMAARFWTVNVQLDTDMAVQ